MRFDIKDKLLSNIWLLEQIFWKYQDKIFIDEVRENKLLILKEVYGFSDIDNFIDKAVKLEVLFPILNKLLTYYEEQEREKTNNK
jgi:hypothetical protein